MKLRHWCFCLLLLIPLAARAETLSLFDTSDQLLLHLSVPSPSGASDSSEGEYFALMGTDDVYGVTDIGFGSSNYFAQFFVAGDFGYDYFNTDTYLQVYSGNESAPTLLTGTYALTSAEGLPYSLVVASDVAATPEPNGVLLCGTGCMLLCLAALGRNGWLQRELS